MLGEIKLGNTELIYYGIQNEESDIRAHVSVLAKKIYVFKTEEGAKIARDRMARKYKPKEVFTNGIVTALGYPVSVLFLPTVKNVPIPQEWMDEVGFRYTDGTSARGEKAVAIVRKMILSNRMPYMSIQVQEVTGKTLQISGTDIVIPSLDLRLQVKCDWRGGFGDHEQCTGNLFLQIAECNPYKQV